MPSTKLQTMAQTQAKEMLRAAQEPVSQAGNSPTVPTGLLMPSEASMQIELSLIFAINYALQRGRANATSPHSVETPQKCAPLLPAMLVPQKSPHFQVLLTNSEAMGQDCRNYSATGS